MTIASRVLLSSYSRHGFSVFTATLRIPKLFIQQYSEARIKETMILIISVSVIQLKIPV